MMVFPHFCVIFAKGNRKASHARLAHAAPRKEETADMTEKNEAAASSYSLYSSYSLSAFLRYKDIKV